MTPAADGDRPSGRRPVRLLHASDLHLHWEQPTHAVASVRGLAAAAVRDSADVVLMAGDIFDTANQPAAFVEEIAAAFTHFTRPVVVIPGNHDIRYSATEPDALGDLGALLPDPHRVIVAGEGESLALLDGALEVWGRGMPEHSPRNDPLAGIAFTPDGGDADGSDGPDRGGAGAWRVVIAHGELVDGYGVSRSSPIILERHRDALECVHYVALGHHDAHSLREWGRTVVCYSGSASPLQGASGYALVDLAEPHGARVTMARWDAVPDHPSSAT